MTVRKTKEIQYVRLPERRIDAIKELVAGWPYETREFMRARLNQYTPQSGFVTSVRDAVGHLFNLIISSLGAFVHSLRLQYVEFFTKFFEGGGRPFNPFRDETTYVVVQEKDTRED